MYYEQDVKKFGGLNDLNLILAAKMKAGERTPKKQGFERTGTLPFMSLDFLQLPNYQISRRFRHDLESCMWCLVWQALAKEREHWYSQGFSRASSAKGSLPGRISISLLKEEWEKFTLFIRHWALSFRTQRDVRVDLTILMKHYEDMIPVWQEADDKANDADLMRPEAKAAREMMKFEGNEALEDLSWIEYA